MPLLYKLFSRLLRRRITPILDAAQCEDQAGFRKKHSTEEHLLTVVLLQEKCEEWHKPLWMAAIDFKKAFDSVSHRSLWAALLAQQVPEEYVTLLQKLYRDQSGTVKTDRTSRSFPIRRGTKQGDPLSPVLFNAVLEHAMAPIKAKWIAKGMGVEIGPDIMTNLRFADDVLLLASSLKDLKEMLTDVSEAVRDCGLTLHSGKTKILCNLRWRRGEHRQEQVTVGKMKIDLLTRDAGTKYLGRKICFSNPHGSELDSRIAIGWRKFFALKQELTSKSYPLKQRLRLFDAVITPCVLYGAACWTLTAESENVLRKAQRRMLRIVAGSGRRRAKQDNCTNAVAATRSSGSDESSIDETVAQTVISEDIDCHEILEPWVDWIRRTTHFVEETLASAGVEDWVRKHKRAKWSRASQVLKLDEHRWSRRVLLWDPGAEVCNFRRVGRPIRRWEGSLNNFLQNFYCLQNVDWKAVAEDDGTWTLLEDEYVGQIFG